MKFCLLIAFFSTSLWPAMPDAVLDLQHADLSGEVKSLGGRWEFYCEPMVQPGTFDAFAGKKIALAVPGIWKGAVCNGVTLTGTGSYTYRLRVALDEKQYPEIAVAMPVVGTASRLIVNGEVLHENGKVGSDQVRTSPAYQPDIVTFVTHPVNEIILHVANFEDRHGGIWENLKIGTSESLKWQRWQIFFYDALVSGALVLLALYFFALYVAGHRFVSSLYLAIFCLCVGARPLLESGRIAHLLLPNISWTWLIKAAHLSFNVGLCAILAYTKSRLASRENSLIFKILIAGFLFFIFSILILPPLWFTEGLNASFAWAAIASAYMFVLIIRALKRRMAGARAIFYSSLLLIAGGIADMLTHELVFQQVEFAPAALIIFAMAQAISLHYHFGKLEDSQERNLKLNKRIQTMLARFVPESFIERIGGKKGLAQVNNRQSSQISAPFMFIDIRGYTTLTERIGIQESFNFVNTYLGIVNPIIQRQGGTIVYFAGDGVFSFFEDSDRALEAAIEISQAMSSYNEANSQHIEIGIGLHFAEGLLTFLGHKDRLDPAVFSPEAEKVQELEALCGQFHSGLLISDRFWGTLKNSEKFNKRLMTALRGENVYEILDILPAAQLLQRKKNNESFALGVAAFWGAEYSMALMAFEGCLRSDVSDRAAKQYADRARGYVDATLMPNIDRQVDAGGFI